MLYDIIHYIANYLGFGLIFTWFIQSLPTDETYSLKEKFLSVFLFPYFIGYIIFYMFTNQEEKEWN
jgi:hypothetical protein